MRENLTSTLRTKPRTSLKNATSTQRCFKSIGFSILADTTLSDLQVLVSTHSPEWSHKSVLEWKEAKDPLLEWIAANIGSTPAADVEGGDILLSGVDRSNSTLISDFYLGTRVGVILSHSSEALDEKLLSEARAAALVIQSLQPDETEFGISAKELIYLKQVSAGATDDEIASELQLSLRAVKERKRKAIDDLNAKNIAHAIGIAKRADLI